jgi:hypothetical protein
MMDYDTLYRRDVDKQLVVDAYGELTTDYGAFEVLRITKLELVSIRYLLCRINNFL